MSTNSQIETTPSLNVFSLEGKIALVTGGGSGIGFYIAQCLAQAGAQLVITGRREEVLKEALPKLGANARYFVNDVTDLKSLPALIETIEAEVGEIDILVNNAGINMKKHAVEVSDEDFDRVIQTNLHAVFSITRECGKRMVERKRGSILMITSMAALYGIDRVVAYTASKSAVGGMVKALTTEFSPYNVRVNAIAPGFIETPMMLTAMNGDPSRRDKAMDRTPMGTWGKPDDIGWAAVFLSSEAAKFITGVSLPVDGGNSIGF
ncbi:gluconate 5-dehydrogenase [Dyadobacter sp. BE34]|uniref:Gluconate 5-dehydrogenase n=1 Tax=Dyadobacter fermentans TaxID=94254 RepID=A0ABU1QQ89_9BACT|nr:MULTISPECIES: glucose 1-dehydrogenase [Dyadobacter]MDR6803258.1 gluconate 5-dehydrogenase [Dyadobacter fermentans]MDR7040999.1 gluconate 5-dehydrogenase [Dyadobacter sp. BE242]MDR7195402.1 gluconate 5-dehydrogenase [Dyadobacter sp. BE34]MDR7214053.1 gluconate 5-dehydrogenase [Dyadobacter sp. BE31]MDR7260809.1 gluconate 5-dehydrogenase [Dyadobacter sp. BE32]